MAVSNLQLLAFEASIVEVGFDILLVFFDKSLLNLVVIIPERKKMVMETFCFNKESFEVIVIGF